MPIFSHGQSVQQALEERGVNRRDFLKFCGLMAAALAMPKSAPVIAAALQEARRPPVIWLELQDCAGCSESFLRASRPSAADIVLETLSVDYHETIMAAAGKQAEEAKQKTIAEGGYLLIVEGSIPTGDDGIYCTIGGKSAVEILREAAANAVAVIAVGNCATFGGIPKAVPNPTQAKGVMELVTDKPVINIPGCPMNVVNLTATVVHYLTFKALPEMDELHRPLFAFGGLIHDNCERRGHFDRGEFVRKWGDAGHIAGWCLYQMGCKGPVTFHNCPTVRFNEGVSWPVGSGHPCIGCSQPDFWDRPFYEPISLNAFAPPAAFAPAGTPEGQIPTVNAVATGAVLGALVAAAGITAVTQLRKADKLDPVVEGETAVEAAGEASPDAPAAGGQD